MKSEERINDYEMFTSTLTNLRTKVNFVHYFDI